MRATAWRRGSAAAAAALCVGSIGIAAPSRADQGTAFEPEPASQPVYGIARPEDDIARQTGVIEAVDGVDLFAEAWLPAATDAAQPPSRVPVVLTITPYDLYERRVPMTLTDAGVPVPTMMTTLMPHLVARGYAFVWAHARGSGRSGGCWDDFGPTMASDGAAFVEWAGTQPWSDGNVAIVGISAGAPPAWATALSGNAPRLKTILPWSGFASMYDAVFMDGVPHPVRNVGDSALFNVFGAAVGEPARAIERPCQTDQVVASLDWSGDFTDYWQEREHRDGLDLLDVPVFANQGIHDHLVNTRVYRGLLDEIPSRVPVKLVLGSYRHGNAGSAEGNPASRRADFFDMVTAWLDRYLKGLPTGVETWPDVQVADANGQWRAERRWVDVPLRGALALSANGVLGATTPTGETSYVQLVAEGNTGAVSFTTPPLSGDLRIYGAPELDVALKVTDANAKIGVRLDAIDPSGTARGIPYSTPVGARSMRHLEDFVDGRFAQSVGVDPPLDTVFRTTIRIQPTEMLVPAGWRLRLSLFSLVGGPPSGGSPVPAPPDTTGLDGHAAVVTVLHDCKNPTVLRFGMADPNATLLNVRQPGEEGDLESASPSSPRLEVDGGGLAVATVC